MCFSTHFTVACCLALLMKKGHAANVSVLQDVQYALFLCRYMRVESNLDSSNMCCS